eukprot:jgi/Bigna1/69120/fgenesh1_pg.8_\
MVQSKILFICVAFSALSLLPPSSRSPTPLYDVASSPAHKGGGNKGPRRDDPTIQAGPSPHSRCRTQPLDTPSSSLPNHNTLQNVGSHHPLRAFGRQWRVIYRFLGEKWIPKGGEMNLVATAQGKTLNLHSARTHIAAKGLTNREQLFSSLDQTLDDDDNDYGEDDGGEGMIDGEKDDDDDDLGGVQIGPSPEIDRIDEEEEEDDDGGGGQSRMRMMADTSRYEIVGEDDDDDDERKELGDGSNDNGDDYGAVNGYGGDRYDAGRDISSLSFSSSPSSKRGQKRHKRKQRVEEEEEVVEDDGDIGDGDDEEDEEEERNYDEDSDDENDDEGEEDFDGDNYEMRQMKHRL